MIKIIKDSAKVILLSLFVLFSIHLASAVWTEPTVAPTGGNASAPLDVSSTGQTKAGGLILNTGGGSTNGLVVSAGKVGIGVADPASALEVYGGSGASSQSTGDIFRLSSSGLGRLLFGFDPITPFGSWIQSNSSYPILLNPVAGNVGIGTTSPSQKLSVAGTIYSTAGFKFPDGTTQTTAAGGAALEAFGGLYTKRDNVCTNTNPLTSACSCASGFTDTTFLSFSVNASFSCGWYEGYTTTGPCGQSSIETHECWNPDVIAVCGNNTREGSEVCDGTDLNSQTCATQAGAGYVGTLSCNAGCTAFVTAACTVSPSSTQTFSYTGSETTFVVPSGVTSLTVDLRGPGGGSGGYLDYEPVEAACVGTGSGGGGGVAGSGFQWAPSNTGAAGSNTYIKRGGTTLAQAAIGKGGNGASGSAGGAKGTSISTGLTSPAVTVLAGSAGGPVANDPDNMCPGGAADAGDKVTGNLSVTPGETLTVFVGAAGRGGYASGLNVPSGTDGSMTLTWAYPNPYAVSTAGSYSFVVPTGVTSLTIDLRGAGGGGTGAGYDDEIVGCGGGGGGGGGGAGSTGPAAGCSGGAGGTAGSDSTLKRGVITLASAATGEGGPWYASGPGGGARGTNSYSGLSLTSLGGGTAGASGGGGCGSFPGSDGVVGFAGDKVTGTIAVTPGEILTLVVGTPGGGGAGASCGNGGNGGNGSFSLSW